MERIKHFLFKNSGIRQTIVKNTFWVALGTTVTKIIRVVVIIYVARILGTDNYGILTYATSLVAVFTIFSDIGLTNILTRELIKRTEEKSEYLSTILIVKLLSIIITTILIVIFTPLISKFEVAKPLLIIFAITFPFESLRNFFYAIIRSENKMEKEAGLNIITEILITIIVLLAFLKYPSAKSLAWSYLIGNGIGLLVTLALLHKYIAGIFKYFKAKLVKPIIKSAWPFAVMGVFGIFMTNIDSVIIGIFNSPHVLGLYAAAQKPINFLYTLPGFLSVSLLPIISKFNRDREEKKLSTLIEKSILSSLIIALPIVIGGIIVAEPLISITFGYEFIGAVSTFQILLLSLLFVFPGAILADLILVKDRQKIFIYSSFFGAITNVGLDLLLIPIYGIVGSAIATVAAQIVVNSIFFIEAQKNIPFNILGHMKKIIIATVIMSLLAYIMKAFSVPLLIILSVSAITYFGLLFLIKEQIIEDIKLTLQTKTK